RTPAWAAAWAPPPESARTSGFISGAAERSRSRRRSGADPGPFRVDLLQAREVRCALAQRPDGPDRGRGGGERGHDKDAVLGRALADRAVVVERLLAEGGVEDDGDLAILDVVHDVGPPFVDLEHGLRGHALRLQELGGAPAREDPEPHLAERAR